MKQWQVILLGILALLGLAALTNPDRAAYETYAVEQIGNLARDKCNQAPGGFGVVIEGPCRAAIDAYKPQLRPLLAATTTRQNWGLFSIYRSDISIPAVNFQARVESIGIFNNFLIYKFP
jgi:Domain of unknown function (DUF4359)